MSVSNLIDPITAAGGKVTLQNVQSWMQGRTLYGGASALVAYTAAQRAFPDLPPLRAGQIGFVAPVGGEFELRSEMVRQGRNVTQVRSDIICEGKVALTTFWLFGTARESNGEYPAVPPTPNPGQPEDQQAVDNSRAPEFLRSNFDLSYTQERRDASEPVIRRWVRLKEQSGIDPISEIILMGDTLPPSAARIMQRRGPISSINWSFNVLDPAPQTVNGWWLAETASDHAADGYSSERLSLWNAQGKQMLSGLQSVAIFG